MVYQNQSGTLWGTSQWIFLCQLPIGIMRVVATSRSTSCYPSLLESFTTCVVFSETLVYCEITENENIREDLKNYSTKLPRVSYLYKVYCDIFQSRHTWVFCLMLLRLTVRICVSVPHVLEQGSHFDQTSPCARISQTRVQDLQIDWTRILINLDHTNAFSKVFVFVAIKTKQAYFHSRCPHLITLCNKILDMKYLASLPDCTVHCSHHIYSISTLVWESNKIERKWRD